MIRKIIKIDLTGPIFRLLKHIVGGSIPELVYGWETSYKPSILDNMFSKPPYYIFFIFIINIFLKNNSKLVCIIFKCNTFGKLVAP